MKTVLTVDDSWAVRAIVARCLTRFGCRVVEAENGDLGVAATRAHRPDLILLDVAMPVLDGRGTLAALRRDPALAAVPVVLLAAVDEPDGDGWLAACGVTGVLRKPFRWEEFARVVGAVLGPPTMVAEPGGAGTAPAFMTRDALMEVAFAAGEDQHPDRGAPRVDAAVPAVAARGRRGR